MEEVPSRVRRCCSLKGRKVVRVVRLDEFLTKRCDSCTRVRRGCSLREREVVTVVRLDEFSSKRNDSCSRVRRGLHFQKESWGKFVIGFHSRSSVVSKIPITVRWVYRYKKKVGVQLHNTRFSTNSYHRKVGLKVIIPEFIWG